jgi:hypothetical protein
VRAGIALTLLVGAVALAFRAGLAAGMAERRYHDLELANAELLAERQVFLDSIALLKRQLAEDACYGRRAR